MDEYDLEAVYDEEIAPLMDRIIAICNEYQMPVIASFAYRTGSFCSTALHFEDRPVERYRAMASILLADTEI